jgi:hypothetical protein
MPACETADVESDAELVPVGSVVSELHWWNRPDKYQGPRSFSSLAKARRYERSGYITVEVRLVTPDAQSVRVIGAVTSVDRFIAPPSRQDDGVLPEPRSVVVELVHRDASRDSRVESNEQRRIGARYREIVFRTPSGGTFVLIPHTTHEGQI